MKVKVGTTVSDTDEEAVLFVFRDNDELVDHIKNLIDMLNHPNDGQRKIVCFPDNMAFAKAREFMDSYPEKVKKEDPDVTNP